MSSIWKTPDSGNAPLLLCPEGEYLQEQTKRLDRNRLKLYIAFNMILVETKRVIPARFTSSLRQEEEPWGK